MLIQKTLTSLMLRTAFSVGVVLLPATLMLSTVVVAQDATADTSTDTDTDTDFTDRAALTTVLFGETAPTAEQQTALDALTDEQVVAINRSLNGTVNNSFEVVLSEELVAQLLSGELNDKQVMFAVRAETEAAKFNQLADKMEEKGLTDQANRMRDRGAAKFDRFNGKVEGFAEDASAEARGAAQSAARLAARDTARDNARGGARENARENARERANENARDNARNAGKPVG